MKQKFNRAKVIEEDILIYAPKISKINLEGTRITCNCINKWIRREETRKEIGPFEACEEITTNTAENCGPDSAVGNPQHRLLVPGAPGALRLR